MALLYRSTGEEILYLIREPFSRLAGDKWRLVAMASRSRSPRFRRVADECGNWDAVHEHTIGAELVAYTTVDDISCITHNKEYTIIPQGH